MDSDSGIVSISVSVSLPEMSHVRFSRGSAELGVDVFKELSVFLPVTRS